LNPEKVAGFLKRKIKRIPRIALILGSGLGELADEVKEKKIFDYKKIPNFPTSTVPGHKGRLVFGKLENKNVLIMQGRFHYYEGYDMDKVCFPVEVFKNIGIKILIVTNASGSINLKFKPGDIVLLKDHINFLGINPLRGKANFVDMSFAYDLNLRKIAKEVALKNNISIKEGVYLFVSGPSYETPSEIKMFKKFGADLVGMSTVPEVIKARSLDIKVIGISLVTNMAAGILKKKLNHKEVIETGKKKKREFVRLIKGIVRRIVNKR